MSLQHAGQPPTIPDHGLVVTSVASFVGFLAILVVVSLDGGVDTFDTVVAAGAQRARGSAVTALARSVTTFGSVSGVVAATLVGVVWLGLRTGRLWSSAILAGSVAATASLVTLLKIAVARARPGAAPLAGNPATDLSFPSGHTTNGTLVYVLAVLLLTAETRHAWWRRTAVGVAMALALLIGLSRLYLGYHWATDVLAGWLLATGVITAAYVAGRRLALGVGGGPAAGSSDPEVRPLPGAARSRPPRALRSRLGGCVEL